MNKSKDKRERKEEKIEPLGFTTERQQGHEITRPPSDYEVFNKINEVISVVNCLISSMKGGKE